MVGHHQRCRDFNSSQTSYQVRDSTTMEKETSHGQVPLHSLPHVISRGNRRWECRNCCCQRSCWVFMRTQACRLRAAFDINFLIKHNLHLLTPLRDMSHILTIKDDWRFDKLINSNVMIWRGSYQIWDHAGSISLSHSSRSQ